MRLGDPITVPESEGILPVDARSGEYNPPILQAGSSCDGWAFALSNYHVALSNLSLFLICVVIWGSTWIAITFQLGDVQPAASVFYRFLLAALILFAFCRLRRLNLRFGPRQHIALAAQGTLMFSLSYVYVYRAEALVVSGLVAMGFSASPLLNMVGVRMAYGTPMSWRVAFGALLGIAGIVLVFLPELGTLAADSQAVRGALYTILAVVTSAAGSVIATRNPARAVPVWQAMAFAMLYGSVCTLLVALVSGERLGFDGSPRYVGSLLYLAVLGSVVAFAGYLTLLERIGAARAGYIGVMVPIVALLISYLFEGFAWRASTWMGIGLSVAGNVVILRRAWPSP
ncbi:MAG TPA: EamA family transporter [Burkholderiales bacterium]|nr:EamA family transporter [Burkholderiales bacterium]